MTLLLHAYRAIHNLLADPGQPAPRAPERRLRLGDTLHLSERGAKRCRLAWAVEHDPHARRVLVATPGREPSEVGDWRPLIRPGRDKLPPAGWLAAHRPEHCNR